MSPSRVSSTASGSPRTSSARSKASCISTRRSSASHWPTRWNRCRSTISSNPLERRKLCRTTLQVPVIGMGTWQTFDTTADRTPIVDEALAAGIDLFDSSPMYGRAEDTLAKALDGHRDEAIIAAKIWTSSPAEGRQQAQHALQLFGQVEIYQAHNLVNSTAQLKMLEALTGDGKVVAVGATHYDPGAFDDLCDVMRTGGLDMIQVPYNPRRREAERRVFPLAAELG